MAGIASEVVNSGTTSAYAEGTSAGRQCAVMESVSGSEKKSRLIMGKLLILVSTIPRIL